MYLAKHLNVNANVLTIFLLMEPMISNAYVSILLNNIKFWVKNV